MATPVTPQARPASGGRGRARRERGKAWRIALAALGCAVVALGATWWFLAGPGATTASEAGRPAGATAEASTAPDAGSSGSAPPADSTGPDASADPDTTDPDTTAPDPTDQDTADPGAGDAAAQAGGVDALLSDSGSARSGLGDAIARASRCERAGVRTIREVTAARREQLARARELAVDALDGGAELKRALVEALDASRAADAAFLAWATRHLDGGCGGPIAEDDDYRLGLSHSEEAQAAKRRFVDVWRPIAATHGLPERQVDDI
ncbi:hypothetical protein [Sphaerisporangium sp. TRM90804]|uniref:hypothetical protein n=1 Tax=Sphaerisporangium sp. TRM90804 TaxID=3031113 RepID=UPI00244D6966|nr:hypothetical protein [Sphaerisporangium sp. TRM90804]MDH2429664.1 hypothetical protein [Sphaerisporangium sp. TRM90804]